MRHPQVWRAGRLITHEEMEHLKDGIHGVVNAMVKK